MKKILIFALVALMLAVNVFAADAAYNENDLKSMLRDIFKMYVEYDRCFGDFIFSTEVKLYDENDLVCKIPEHTLYAQRNGAHNTWDGFQSALKACVTETLADKFIAANNILNIDGYTYSQTVVLQAQNDGVWLEPTDMGSEEFEHFDLDSTFEVVSATDDKIEAKFLLYFFDHENPIREFTVEYTKTNAGWRVSGGTFVDNLLLVELDCFNSAPQTGIDTFAYAAVAVVALAAAAVVVKKRRIV